MLLTIYKRFGLTALLFSFLTFPALCQQVKGENHGRLILNIQERFTHIPLVQASVSLKSASKQFYSLADKDGNCIFDALPYGKYLLKVSCVGYQNYGEDFVFSSATSKTITMTLNTRQLKEVTITASETRGMTSSSTITREAIEHIQPTSFSDLLELLPGGSSKDPKMGSANTISLREAGKSSDHNISSLGVAFVIDGTPINTDANLQFLPGANASDPDISRRSVNKGVDMRMIPTDDIEKVEIVRGIPSVDYGDLTGGVVKIVRKSKPSPWEARIKVDEYSKLYSVGKGFGLNKQRTTLNFNVDFLDSKVDPRNNFEKYKRLTGSLRLSQQWTNPSWRLRWQTALDYTGSFDDVKRDPDISLIKEDFYKSSYNKTSFNNGVFFKPKKKSILPSIDLSSSISFENSLLERRKFISIVRDTPIPNNMEEGEHDGVYLPYQYMAEFQSEGKPIYAFAKLKSNWELSLGVMKNKLAAGVEWNYSKNIGRGEMYDINRPITPLWNSRPRAFKDIPAYQKLAFFMEDNITLSLGSHIFYFTPGIRTLSFPGMSKLYTLHNRVYWEARINAKWGFKELFIAGHPLIIELGGGWGRTSKVPTLEHLYPNKHYNDIIQLNYYHENIDFRRLHLRTYIVDKTNYALQTARNEKWELRADLTYRDNRFSVTYFKEALNSGFRSVSYFHPYAFRKYDVKSIDHASVKEKPKLEDFKYEDKIILDGYSRSQNGSALYKEGIEFQYSSGRIRSIRSKFTLNGAWFRTTYTNSMPLFRPVSTVIDNEAVRDSYVGLYDYNEGHLSERFNSNLIADTQIPELGLIFSTTAQCLWFTRKQVFPKETRPFAYMDTSGTLQAFDEAAASHPVLQHLVREANEGYTTYVPIGINLNFKATKELGNFLKVALFVNRILDYHPDYYSYGLLVRRQVDAYFGMELNWKL